MNSREFFNSRAEEWDSFVYHDESKLRNILGQVCLKSGDNVLDVGTGTGVMIPYLREIIGDGGRITAVDISENMIRVAESKFNFRNVAFITGDALEIALPESSFDCVMCYSMFPHFNDKRAAVLKLADYLKKGGRLVIAHSQSRDAINGVHREASEAVRDDELPTAETIKGYFTHAGLDTAVVTDNEDMFFLIGSKP